MKKLFTLFAVAALAFASQANELTVCDGTTSYANLPVYGLYTDTEGTLGQMIYPAEMLTDMVGQEITQVKFYAEEIKFSNVMIQLSLKSNVDKEDFEDYNIITDATPVAQVVPEVGTTELVFDLDEPFVYEGGNLLVECLVVEPGTYATVFFYGEVTDYYAGIHQYTWSTWSDPSVVRDFFLPKATFTYNGGDTPEPPTPTEKTQTPDGSYAVVSGQHEVVVTITPYEGDVFYRIIFTAPDGTITEGEWMEYTDAFSVYEDGHYRVEFYAIADGKLPSDPGAVEFTVSPMTGIEEMTTGKTVAGVRYFNMAGQEMSQANGLTIVVTTYTDGTTSAVKVMK